MFPRGLQSLLIVFFVIWFGHRPLVEIIVDWQWFESVGHSELFLTKISTQIKLWVIAFVVTAAFIFFNIRQSIKIKPIPIEMIQEQLVDTQIQPEQIKSILKGIAVAITFLPAILIASMASSQWLNVLNFFGSETFGRVDYIFGKDIGFYVFQLPILLFTWTSLVSLVVLTLIIVATIVIGRDIFLGRGKVVIHQDSVKHLLFLGGLFFLLLSIGWFFDRYTLLFSHNGVVYGAGYTDINARLPAYYIMMALAVIVSITMFVGIRKLNMRLPIGMVAVYFVARILLVTAWPTLIQSLMVQPNELAKEKEYLEENIKSTREAYGLNRISPIEFNVSMDLSSEDIANNSLTIDNIRILDDRPLLDTYGQLQEIRTYYDFVDVDVDRYTIDGKLRQVMLSARELNYDNLSAQAQTWMNQHLQYTHGYGLTMSPVNTVTEDGQPDLWIQDIPPKSEDFLSDDMAVDNPAIYFGEKTDSYVIIGDSIEEFDYPIGDQNIKVKYSGADGVPIGGFFQKALFSLHFGTIDLLFSQYIDSSSRILINRNISDRVRNLAPFLDYDQDPYLVLAEGKLYWIIDAYTSTDKYPYSESIRVVDNNNQQKRSVSEKNYWRNSVKVIVDAYEGTIDFYISDPEDPMIRVYSKIFPNTFQSIDNLPESLASHIRYPTDYFNIQAHMFRTYHMEDPNVFYNKEDLWAIPYERYGAKENPMESYYLIMKLPDNYCVDKSKSAFSAEAIDAGSIGGECPSGYTSQNNACNPTSGARYAINKNGECPTNYESVDGYCMATADAHKAIPKVGSCPDGYAPFPDNKEEFVLLLPFVPSKKDNMISWLAARSDGENYGDLVLYKFPKQEMIFGPRQMEAQIDQDEKISQQITLWSQAGSNVIRGNLLVIPIEDSLLYVEPLYLVAVESSQLPMLRQVIVSYNNKIVMEPTLGEALNKLFDKPAMEEKVEKIEKQIEQVELPVGKSTTWQTLAERASQLLDEAETHQKEGEWAKYGNSLAQLRTTLSELDSLAKDEETENSVDESKDPLDSGEQTGDELDKPLPDAEQTNPNPSVE